MPSAPTMLLQSFFHGTRADLKPGDLIAVGHQSNFTGGNPLSWVYFAATLDAAIEQALRNIRAIQNLSVRMAFDDFGTGYASLSYLKKFRLDVLKIDRSFVMGLGQSSDAIVSAAIALGKQSGLSVIAEGIEDPPTADVLRRMGCSEGQGYLFGKPMPASEFEDRFFGSIEVKNASSVAA